jgi:hypothetical protein
MFNPQPKTGKKVKKPKFMKTKNHNKPTAADRKYWGLVAALGCIVKKPHPCLGDITIHHCGTGAGGRKDHRKVIGLCWNLHLSHEFGIDGRGEFTKKSWQDEFGTELEHLQRTKEMLGL